MICGGCMEDKVSKEQLTMFGTEQSPFSKKSSARNVCAAVSFVLK